MNHAIDHVRHLLSLSLLGLALLGSAMDSHAANAMPPDNMTYQGYLVDANGNALAPDNPANYPVIFRIYNAATGGTLLWTEQQIVTIDKGNFSVLLGEGSEFGNEARPALSTVFTGGSASDRFIGITVTIEGQTTEILPRLRLLPTPYAYLARNANALVGEDGVPLVTPLLAGGVAQMNVAGNVTATAFSGTGTGLTALNAANVTQGVLDSARIPNLDASKIATGAFQDARIPSNLTGTRTFSGPVGIGTAVPNYRLSLGSDLANSKFAIWDANASSAMGFGVQPAQFRFHLNASSDRFSFLNSQAGSEVMSIRGGGNVGIGVSDPAARLHISDNTIPTLRLDSSSNVGTWLAMGNSSGGGRYWQLISTGSANGGGPGRLHIGAGDVAGQSGAALFLSAGAPTIEVMGGVRARGGTPGSFGNNNNGYAFSGNGGDNDSGLFSTTDGRVSLYVNSVEKVRVDANFAVYGIPFGDRRNMQWDESTGIFYQDNSSRRYKENIRPLEDRFEKLLDAEPKTYTRPGKPDFWEIGFIAEEFHDLGLNKLVDYDAEGRPDGVNYEKICLYLTRIAHNQRDQLTTLEARNQAQVEQLQAQDAKVNELEARIADLETLVRRMAALTPPPGGSGPLTAVVARNEQE